MVELKNASKKYRQGAREIHALRDVSLGTRIITLKDGALSQDLSIGGDVS